MPKIITLKKNEDHRIANGHLWAFSNEVEKIEGEPQAGDIVELRNHAGRLLGIALYNPHSLIACRLLTRQVEEIDFHFFRKRIAAALALRKKLYPNSEVYRLVHGESDYLPGLIIDRYNEYLSIQAFSFGMDKRLTLICDVLDSLLHPKGIVERNEAPIRSLEHLELKKGILRGSVAEVAFTEYGIKYSVDLMEGQKTGFFLDQRENRKAIRRYAKGVRVLDCFCNDGGFALNAAFAGATEVIAVDISETAISRASGNAIVNGVDKNIRFVTGDVFDYLKQTSGAQEKFDLIILDPPSFAKSKKALVKAKRGYKEIHELAIQLLAPGSILATASCSHHVYEETFLEIVSHSGRAANRNISLLEWRGAAPDHPILPAMAETRYLKFGIFQVD